MFAKAVKKHN